MHPELSENPNSTLLAYQHENTWKADYIVWSNDYKGLTQHHRILNHTNSMSFHFRRSLFIWENEELEVLLNLLDGHHISNLMRLDQLIWNACNSKSYSVSSMYNLSLIPASNDEINASNSFKWVWKNAAPFRV